MHSEATTANHRYPAILMVLHWLTFMLVTLAYALAELKGFTDRGSNLRAAMLHLHYLNGLLVFTLTWVRLALRTSASVPVSQPIPPRWLRLAAMSIHIVLYTILIALPLLGWLALSAKADPVHLFFFDLPLAPIDLDPALARPLRTWHARIANAGYALIGLHAAAALIHHYVLRDNALVRMLPLLHQRLPNPVKRLK